MLVIIGKSEKRLKKLKGNTQIELNLDRKGVVSLTICPKTDLSYVV